jgi:hypothetical protein
MARRQGGEWVHAHDTTKRIYALACKRAVTYTNSRQYSRLELAGESRGREIMRCVPCECEVEEEEVEDLKCK